MTLLRLCFVSAHGVRHAVLGFFRCKIIKRVACGTRENLPAAVVFKGLDWG